jgi:hypothetical protein
MQLMRYFWDAAGDLDPAARALDEGPRFPLCRPGPLGDAFRAAGFRNVAVEPIEVSADYADFDAFWTPFLGGVGAAPTKIATPDEPTHVRIRARLRSTVPREPDGSIRLAARAWAVRGVN